jgi:hypothetical protein
MVDLPGRLSLLRQQNLHPLLESQLGLHWLQRLRLDFDLDYAVGLGPGLEIDENLELNQSMDLVLSLIRAEVADVRRDRETIPTSSRRLDWNSGTSLDLLQLRHVLLFPD